MVTRTDPLSITRQYELLDPSRSTFYHAPKPTAEGELELMQCIDRSHTELPFLRQPPHRDLVAGCKG
jgi:hypothetical protein